jgi:acyl-CoA thioester hydrolase
MQALITYRGMVYPWHCDHLGHMNNMWYAGKFDEASWNLLLQLGITPTYLRENGRGMVSVEQVTAFKKELFAGDLVEVRTEVLEVREKAVRFLHTMYKTETGEAAATCTITGVQIDTKLRKSAPFTTEVRATAERVAGFKQAA